MSVPYERVTQWLAGPISILAGWASTLIVQHATNLGVSKDQVASAIVTATTFATGAILTYAAHHKWLTNLPKWWFAPAQAPEEKAK